MTLETVGKNKISYEVFIARPCLQRLKLGNPIMRNGQKFNLALTLFQDRQGISTCFTLHRCVADVMLSA